jgi:hypothetical protein
MMDYNAITELETNPGAPGTSSLWKRWWKNPLAMFEGALGAPRLQLGALENPTAGAVPRSRRIGAFTTTATTDVTVHNFGFGQSGSVRVTAGHRTTNALYPSTLKIKRVRNGVSTDLITYTTTATGNVARSLDASFIPGDEIIITHSIGSGGTSTMQDPSFLTAGESLWPFATGVELE